MLDCKINEEIIKQLKTTDFGEQKKKIQGLDRICSYSSES
jgi:hypothetical protein